MRLAVVASHPVQYYAPLFRALAREVDLKVFYGHKASEADQARAGFGVGFDWDIDLLSGYDYEFLENRAARPGLGRFFGVDTPDIGAKLRSGRFDAVLLLGWYLKCFIQALAAAKRAGIPVMVRGDSQLGTPRSRAKTMAKEWLYPPFLRLFDAALVVGTRNREYWRHYGYPDERMFASPHCVDTEWFAARATPEARRELRARLGIAEHAPVALFAGKLIDFKRPTDVILAAATALQQGLPLEVMVAGAGPLEQAMRETASERGVPLHMLGFCNQSEMPAAYAAADCLVLPSTGRETWGLVANEALACGCPVVLSDAVGCARDLTMVAGAGKTYPMGNADACAEAIVAALQTASDRSGIRQASHGHSLAAAAQGIVEAGQFLTKGGCRQRG